MSLIHLKVKEAEKAQHLLNKVLKKYRSDIIAYDIERIDCIELSDPNVVVEDRRISRKGGSLIIPIPAVFVKYFNLEPNSTLYFVYRKSIGQLYLTKAKYLIPEKMG
jgi:hypothetical protein